MGGSPGNPEQDPAQNHNGARRVPVMLGLGVDLCTRIEALLIELRQARADLDRAETLLAEARSTITARDARLGGAHELLRAQQRVEEARRLVTAASGALEMEKASLADRRPPN
jgi:hypothetical protein